MPVVGRRNADGVDVGVCEKRLVVLVKLARPRLDALGELGFLLLQGAVLVAEIRKTPLEPPFEELRVERGIVALKVRLVDVGKRRHFDERVLHEDVEELRAAVPDADEAHAHPGLGALRP